MFKEIIKSEKRTSLLYDALQEGLKMTVILSENHGYQSIHALQRRY